MEKISISYKRLEAGLDKFEDKIIGLEEDTLDFLDTEHTSKETREQLSIIRTQSKRALNFHKVCKKYKNSCEENCKNAARELCTHSRELRKDIRSIETKLISDYEQLWKEEEKKENARDMSPVYKAGFILAVPVGMLTIGDLSSKVSNAFKLFSIGIIFGTGIAYNRNIQKALVRTSNGIKNSFPFYFMKETAKKYGSKALHPIRKAQSPAPKNDKLSMK